MSLFNFNGMKFPSFTMQQLNLDWILTEIKRVMGFFPEDGDPGTVLMKTEDGTAWEELDAVDININGVPEDTEITDTDKLIFYDLSSSANRKITAPNLLNSMMSNGSPLMDGTASAGTSKKPARYDHRHPTDTSRAPASYFQNNALKVANGGTGATNARDARINLDIPMHFFAHVIPKSSTYSIGVSPSERGIIITATAGTTGKLMIIYNTTSGGVTSFKSVNPNDDIVNGVFRFTSGDNVIMINNTDSSTALFLWKIVFDVTEISE